MCIRDRSVSCKANNKLLFRGKSSPKNALSNKSSIVRKEENMVTLRKSCSKLRPRVKELMVETNIEKQAQKENLQLIRSPHSGCKIKNLVHHTRSEKSTNKRFNFNVILEASYRKGPQVSSMCRAQPKVLTKGENSMDTIDESLEHLEDSISTKRTTNKMVYRRVVQI
eukprot:TRINITY_DN7828_c0_g2_i1.p3 TRINITY_DN7828_c0_g2~~TRINITY_DN7828_c0_g2_i1.p3  ORF type:complete len:168 (+),score=33.03 TRINITY_DN7828_c0_g2_i1:76-579(+)